MKINYSLVDIGLILNKKVIGLKMYVVVVVAIALIELTRGNQITVCNSYHTPGNNPPAQGDSGSNTDDFQSNINNGVPITISGAKGEKGDMGDKGDPGSSYDGQIDAINRRLNEMSKHYDAGILNLNRQLNLYKDLYKQVLDKLTNCDSNPCVNSSECIDLELDYKCTCLPGFTGKNCDTELPRIFHRLLNGALLTYGSAKKFCLDQGADLCYQSQICPNNIPEIIGVVRGDNWAPIRDNDNDWVEIGDDGGRAQRVCLRHNEGYPPPPWGITTGPCPPWNQDRVCDLKRHVFCCTQ